MATPGKDIPGNILIIDDDQNICRFLSESLRLRGYGVKSFASGEPGMDELLTGRYDLALIDVMLPGLSGLEVCQALRAHPATRTLPVVLMSAFYKEASQIREAKEQCGATDCLLKPFTLDALFRKIEELIGGAPGPEPEDALSIEGSLTETAVPQLLHNLYTLRTTGLLHLEREEAKKVVYVKEGYPIFVRSNLVRECLGQMLVRDGLIAAADCDESLRRVKESGHLQGTVLIEMGLLTPHQLHESLERQVTEKLLEVFSWTQGSYRFIQARDFKRGITAIELSPAALILQGIRRFSPAGQIAGLLRPHRHRYLAQTENPHYRFQEMGLSPREAQIFGQCRGDLTLDQLLRRHPLSRQETEQLLAALLIAEMVASRKAPARTEAVEEDSVETAEGRRLRDSLVADYGRMMQQDYFSLLGVDEKSGKAEVRKAYFRLVKRYHPDRYFQEHLSAELKGKIDDLFQHISEAYSVLTDPVRKKAYLTRESAEKKKAEAVDILQAETAFQKGLVLLKVKNFAEAYESLGWAVKLSPDEPEYLTHYAWALCKNFPDEPPRALEAREILLRSAELDPRLDMTHLFLGYLLKEEGRGREAEKEFELAIQCNPDCTEALRELRLFDLRREKASKAKGLMGKVFKK